MIHSKIGKSVLSCSCVIAITLSGCVTISSPALTKGNKKSNVKQVSYEEELPPTPPDPKNPEELKLAYARWMEEMNQVVEARKHYSSVTETQPENVQAILGLARLDQVTGQQEEAEQKYKKALKLEPDSAIAMAGLGQYYASQKRWSEAIEQLSASVQADPESVNARYHLAVALVHQGNVDEALPHFIRTVGDAEGHYNAALILHEEQRYDLAEKHFLLAASKKPGFVQAQQWLSRMQAERNGTKPGGFENSSATNHVVPVSAQRNRTGQMQLQ